MKHRPSDLERRLLVLAPIGKDGALIQSAIGSDVMDCECYVCPGFDVLVREVSRGAVALLISGANHVFDVFAPEKGHAKRAVEATVEWFLRTL